MNFEELFKKFESIKIGVIGDVMLDTYWWGKVERISPEAPVPVVAITHTEQRIGGAGNVALNLVGLGAQVSLITVCGKDADGQLLRSLLNEANIKTSEMVASELRSTTNKIRIISRNQHMMRLDAESTNYLSAEEEDDILDKFEKYIHTEKPSLVILEDYNKGVLTPRVIEKVLSICQKHKVLTTVDPKRKNFFLFKGVDVFKPNLQEIKESLNIISESVAEDSLAEMHKALQEKLGHHTSLITLSEKGVYFQNENEKHIIPTHVRSIADVSGAGDTVIAVASLVYAATQNVKLMAEIANIAGGLVCEEVGTVAIDKQKLLQECEQLLNLRS